ncbi:hypothetical protein [Azospirillum sp. sgz301742]
MAPVYTDVGKLNGLFKQVYADSIADLYPDNVKFTKIAKFTSKDKELGDFYNQPFRVKLPQGTTRSNSNGSAFSLNEAVSGEMVNAQVRGSEYLLRDTISYGAAARAVGSRNAFMDATQVVVEGMRKKIARDIEADLMYGQTGIGEVASVAGNVITLKGASWAPGLWVGQEGMKIQTWAAVSGETTPTNTAGTGVMTVLAINTRTKSITVDNATGVAANHHIFEFGAYTTQMAGLDKILTNTGSLFGINWSSYSILRPTQYSINDGGTAGALSFAALDEALEEALAKGMGEDVTLLTSFASWSDLHREVLARREIDSSYATAQVDVGSKSIRYFNQNGVTRIVGSSFVKNGKSYLFADRCMLRVGSTDVTFRRPGQGDQFFRDLENNAGYELRAYTDQALFCEAPGQCVVIDNIAPGVVA